MYYLIILLILFIVGYYSIKYLSFVLIGMVISLYLSFKYLFPYYNSFHKISIS
jgi:hypothetical protein